MTAQRTLLRDLSSSIGQEVLIQGSVDVRRDQGKMIFFDIRDRSGKVQCVVLPGSEAMETAKRLRPEWVVGFHGVVNKRPEKNVNQNVQNGDVELEVKYIDVLSEVAELPFERDADVNLDTCLNYRPYTLRSEANKAIFKLQAAIVEEYRQSLRRQEFVEFQAPAIVGGDAEGGAAAFKVGYYDHTGFLATSPQFYKEIMVGPFERSFTVAKIFRGEKHATARHLSELTQMDFEMGFIENELEPMAVLETVVRDVVSEVGSTHKDIFEAFKVPVPALGKKFPILTLREIQKILGVKEEDDLVPEDERRICEWALKEHGSDFVFVTRFPTSVRAFYTYEDPSEAPYSRGFDLLFRGLEINSGSQRIHNYDMLVERIKSRGMKPELFSFYLQAFKYGLPPHGGSSTGLERFTMKMLNLPNVREATAFPRDMNRIDNLLSN
ncbi:MAG: aspartate--tRNA(Asn) ligase [Patescibacteria group bacterium]